MMEDRVLCVSDIRSFVLQYCIGPLQNRWNFSYSGDPEFMSVQRLTVLRFCWFSSVPPG